MDFRVLTDLSRIKDATFSSAEQTLAAEKLNLPLAKAAFAPSLALAGALSLNYTDVSQEGSSSNGYSSNQTQLGLDASKKLIDPSASLDIELARVMEGNAVLTYDIAQQALIQRSIARYLAVLSAIDNLVLAQREKEAIAKQLDLSTQRLEVGLGTKTDQYDAVARYAQSKATVISAENAVVDAIESLEELIGVAGQFNAEDFAILSDAELQYEVDNSEQWLLQALVNNKTLQQSRMQLAMAQINLEKTQKLRSPGLDASGSWGINDASSSASGFGSSSNSWRVGLNARYPLYQAGTVKVQQEKAGYQLNAAELTLEQTRRQTQSSIRTAQRSVETII